jgi:hypothetical protein
MSLSADPTYTRAAVGNVIGSTSLAAGTTAAAFTFSVGDSSGSPSSALGGTLQVYLIATTVAATAGLTVTIYKTADTTPTYSTVAYITGPTIPGVTSSTTSACIDLPPGQYSCVVTNLDATNAVHYEATLAILA